MGKKIRVLIVDDSSVVRQTLSNILSFDQEIEIMGLASNPYEAVEYIKSEVPDVITLDVEMPRMDGITFLKKIMTQHPIPVVICSSVADSGTGNALEAMKYGAVDIITKPRVAIEKFLMESQVLICDTVKAAAITKPKLYKDREIEKNRLKPTPLEELKNGYLAKVEYLKDTVILIGASTGGTEAVASFLTLMPKNCPGIVIVQHMPKLFTKAFADRLDRICEIEVREAKNNDKVRQGSALIAPGGESHTLLKRYKEDYYYVEVREGPLVSRHRPSVDVLFRSAARYAGKNAIGIIMTGMGNDGASGMLELKKVGSRNIAQDENSCVVFGMPKEAIKLGAVDLVVPLAEMPRTVLEICARLVSNQS